jgi:hypothetical protein
VSKKIKKLDEKNLKVCFLFFVIVAQMGFSNSASAETLDSVSHIHHVKVVEKKVLVLTHEGLFELVKRNEMKLVGKDKIDVMGFTTLDKALFASGHPSVGSTMLNPIGLVKSIDGGLSWKTISLVGKVDFHFLEGAGSDLYGADSQTGKFMYSADSGLTWKTLGEKNFTDIAVSPKKSGMAIAINGPELLLTTNAFKTSSKIKSSLKITQIEWRESGLYALSGSSLYKSTNIGRTWTEISAFKGTPGLLSASDQLMLVTVGSDIYTSKNKGKEFKIFS